jgi:hypothetical protein
MIVYIKAAALEYDHRRRKNAPRASVSLRAGYFMSIILE